MTFEKQLLLNSLLLKYKGGPRFFHFNRGYLLKGAAPKKLLVTIPQPAACILQSKLRSVRLALTVVQ